MIVLESLIIEEGRYKKKKKLMESQYREDNLRSIYSHGSMKETITKLDVFVMPIDHSQQIKEREIMK
jgi:hypothetical protein